MSQVRFEIAPAEDEVGLVAALKEGDAAAYRTLVERHGPRCLAVARRLLEREDDAQDAVQDAFLCAFRSIGRFEGGARIATWLHRIVVNAALMRLRAKKRRPEVAIEDLLPEFAADDHHAARLAAPSAQDPLEAAERRAVTRQAIAALPALYRTVLVLRDIEELDTAETAGVLGISPNAVKVRLHRARQALRTLLERAAPSLFA